MALSRCMTISPTENHWHNRGNSRGTLSPSNGRMNRRRPLCLKLSGARREPVSSIRFAVLSQSSWKELRFPAQASTTSVSCVRWISVWVIKSFVYKANMIIPQISEESDEKRCARYSGNVSRLRRCHPDSDDEQCRDPLLYESRCPAKFMKAFTLFVSRDAMNIDWHVGGNAPKNSWATASSVSLPIFSVSTATATRLWRWTVSVKNHTRI